MSASPPHTDSSLVFARCANVHRIWHTLTLAHRVTSQTPYRSVQLFLRSSWQSPYTIQWAALFLPSKMPLRIAASGPHSTRGSFGQPESTTQRVSGSVESFLQDPRSWQIDHATPSVAIGRIFVAQRCGLIIVVLWSFCCDVTAILACILRWPFLGFWPSVNFLSFSDSDPNIGLWTKVSYNFLIFKYEQLWH